MNDIRAVVFDVDGTLLDTREFIAQAFEYSLAMHGHCVPERESLMSSVSGIHLKDCYLLFAPNGDVHALMDTHRAFQLDRFDLILAYHGLHELLDMLREQNIKLGVCSSRAQTLKPSLEHVQALRYFDAVLDANDVVQHKPHPEGVLRVLALLGVPAGNSVMIGDTTVDIGAGKSAQCAMTIGVTHGFGTRSDLEAAGATHVVDSLSEILPLI